VARHIINKCYTHSTCVISCQFVSPLSLESFLQVLSSFPLTAWSCELQKVLRCSKDPPSCRLLSSTSSITYVSIKSQVSKSIYKLYHRRKSLKPKFRKIIGKSYSRRPILEEETFSIQESAVGGVGLGRCFLVPFLRSFPG
jgi:hypothetical protein